MSILKCSTCAHGARTFANEMFEKCAATAWKTFYDRTAFIFNVFMSNNKNKHNNSKPHEHWSEMIREIKRKFGQSAVEERRVVHQMDMFLFVLLIFLSFFSTKHSSYSHTHTYIEIFQQYFYIFKMKNEEDANNKTDKHTHTYIHHKRDISWML